MVSTCPQPSSKGGIRLRCLAWTVLFPHIPYGPHNAICPVLWHSHCTQDAMDELNGRSYDGRDLRIRMDEGRPRRDDGGGRNLSCFLFFLFLFLRWPRLWRSWRRRSWQARWEEVQWRWPGQKRRWEEEEQVQECQQVEVQEQGRQVELSSQHCVSFNQLDNSSGGVGAPRGTVGGRPPPGGAAVPRIAGTQDLPRPGRRRDICFSSNFAPQP